MDDVPAATRDSGLVNRRAAGASGSRTPPPLPQWRKRQDETSAKTTDSPARRASARQRSLSARVLEVSRRSRRPRHHGGRGPMGPRGPIPPRTPPPPSLFEGLTAIQPYERLKLETNPDELSMRAMDMIAPIGRGQRGLIVAPPRTGKTMLLQKIAGAVLTNHPEVAVIVLLVDERPEEVTDFRMTIGKSAEIVASSNDNPYRRHIEVTEQVLDKAKRMVEQKRDVLILFDSLTRMTRAYNNELVSRGRTMSGGIDSRAFQMPRAFFGAARKIEEGGSLTIVGTVLVDTGSRMDQIIFEEFKGTGNMEVYLSRELSDRRIFPSFDLMRSGTRREELLFGEDEMKRIHLLRRALSGTKPLDAMEALLERLRLTATNTQFLKALGS